MRISDWSSDVCSSDLTTISRRGSIGIGAGAIAAAGVARAEGREDDPIVVVSTWDFGKAAHAAALAKLDAGGTALDAVEAGARGPEADPENHSVGHGGSPERDGPLKLHATLMDEDGMGDGGAERGRWGHRT